MAITYVGSASSPADNGSLASSANVTVTPPAGCQAGDLVFATVHVRTTGSTFSVSAAAGQTWNSLTSFASAASQIQSFWCVFNGTWTGGTVTFDPSVSSTVPASATMVAFRPTTGYTWSVDTAQSTGSAAAPTTPFTMTATGATPTAASTVAIATFTSDDDNTYGTVGGGWTIATFGGANQVRNTAGNDTATGVVYKIQTSAAATGNATLNQTALGGDAYAWSRVIFAESSPIPNLVMRLSGGAANNDPNASIGGAMSSNAAPISLFDNVSSGESSSGDTEYRCVYVYNPGSTPVNNVSLWIDTNTPSASSTVALAIGAAAAGATETAVADEGTAPGGGVTFSTPGVGSELFVGNMAATQGRAIWLRRTITAGAGAATDDSVIIKVGDDAVQLETETAAFIARMATEPDATRKAAINAFVVAIKAIGWAKFDAVYLFAAHEQATALLNLKGSTWDCTIDGSPTFTVDSGFNGAGADGRLNTGFNPSNASGRVHLQDDSHISGWSLTTTNISGSLWAQASSTNMAMAPRWGSGDNNAYFRHHSTADDSNASTDASGFWLTSRGSSANFVPYKNGTSLGTKTRASAAPNSSNILFLDASGETAWTGRIACGSIGANLTSGEVTSLYSAFQTYLQAVGAV